MALFVVFLKGEMRNMGKNRLSRRGFFKRTASAIAGTVTFPYIVSSSALGADGKAAPSNRITLGFIGIGNHGGGVDMPNFLGNDEDSQIIAVCDVNQNNLNAAQEKVDNWYKQKGCAGYNDIRELIGRADIDAVAIVSPDHWHVLHAVWAARAGKDVYLEKPMGLSIEQDKILRDTIKRYDRVFQFGPEQRQLRDCRFACELVRNGRIGKLHTIKVGSPASISSPNYPPMPVPDWLDYEMWLGPAPWAPYTANRIKSSHWFHISDYALGYIAGWGIHHIDLAHWGAGFDQTGPVEIEGTGVYPQDGLCDCATSWDVNLTYPNGVKLSYASVDKNKMGVRFEGDEGWVHAHFSGSFGSALEGHPKSILKSVIAPDEVHLPAVKSLERNFLDCVKTRQQTVCPIEAAVRSDTVCHLSNIAMRLGRKLRWDPVKEHFVNDDQANRMLCRAMRSPWSL